MPNQRPPIPPKGAPPPLAAYRPSAERGAAPPQPRRGPPPPGHHINQPRGPAGGQPPRRRRGVVSTLLGFLVLLVAIAGTGAAYLVLNPPSELIRQTLAIQVKEKTGRDLVVAGPASFSFWPGLGVSLKDVTLSGPPGSPNKLVTMAALDVNIKTMPLLSRQIEVRRLVLKKPVFDFRVDKQGRKNWQLAAASLPVRYAQAAAPQPVPGAAPTATDAGAPASGTENPALAAKLAQIKHVQLGDVRIEDGTLRYTDERSGKTQQVSAVNVQVAMQSLNSPVTAKGNLAWQGEKIDFDGKLSTAKMVLEEKPARLVFKADNRNINASFDGAVQIHDGADLEGKITAKSESVKSLAKWLGSTLPPVTGFGPLSLAGTLKTNGNVTSLSNANLGLDGATGTGTVTVTTGGVRPAVQATLKLSELDLNKYMIGAAGAAPAPQPAKKPAAAGAPANAGDKAGDAIEELLQVPASGPPATGPKVHGFTERAGWSSEPLNLTLFGVVDADAKLQIGRLLYQDIKVGQSTLTVALKNKVMKTAFDNVQLYEGQGSGFLNVDGTGKAAQVGANFVLEGLAALPFLKDAADMDWLAGTTKLTLQLAAQGGSQLQLVETLNGKADFAFANGAIVGFNLPGAIRGLSQGKISGLRKAPAEKTDFSELAASFTIANGIAQNQDLRLTSPLLRVTGAGAVQLPPKTIDYTVKPKLVASLEGQKGAADLSGLEIPVRITGPWDKPKFEPDLKGVLADPNKAIEAVKQIGKQFKGKSAKEIADELLGKKGGTGATGSTAKAKDLLKNLLKPQ